MPPDRRVRATGVLDPRVAGTRTRRRQAEGTCSPLRATAASDTRRRRRARTRRGPGMRRARSLCGRREGAAWTATGCELRRRARNQRRYRVANHDRLRAADLADDRRDRRLLLAPANFGPGFTMGSTPSVAPESRCHQSRQFPSVTPRSPSTPAGAPPRGRAVLRPRSSPRELTCFQRARGPARQDEAG